MYFKDKILTIMLFDDCVVEEGSAIRKLPVNDIVPKDERWYSSMAVQLSKQSLPA